MPKRRDLEPPATIRAQSPFESAHGWATQGKEYPFDPKQLGLLAPGTVNDEAIAFLKSLGKPVSELLGAIFTTHYKGGLPSRLRLTNWDNRTGQVLLHGVDDVADQQFRAAPHELDQLINQGVLGLEQPPVQATRDVQQQLATKLDAASTPKRR